MGEILKLDDGRMGFSDLSAELRNEIYKLSLTSPDPIQVYESFWDKAGNHRLPVLACSARTTLRPALLVTCRFINGEAAPILYGANLFRVDRNANPEFFKKLGRNLDLVREVQIKMCPQVILSTGLHVLKKCHQLDRLVFDHYFLAYKEPKQMAKLIGPWAREVHKQRKGTGDKGVLYVLEWEVLIPGEEDAVEETKALIRATFK